MIWTCEGDPLTPPEGEAAQGEHPPDPFFREEIFINFMRFIAIWEMPKRRKHNVLEPPRAITFFLDEFYRA
jgi:hypothetical protein